MMLSRNEFAIHTASLASDEYADLDAARVGVPALFLAMSNETIATASGRTFENRDLVQRIAERAGADLDTHAPSIVEVDGAQLASGRYIVGRRRYLHDTPLGDLA